MFKNNMKFRMVRGILLNNHKPDRRHDTIESHMTHLYFICIFFQIAYIGYVHDMYLGGSNLVD